MGTITNSKRNAEALSSRAERHVGVDLTVLCGHLGRVAALDATSANCALVEANRFIDDLTAIEEEPARGLFRPGPRTAWCDEGTFYTGNLYATDVPRAENTWHCPTRDFLQEVCIGCLRLVVEDYLDPDERHDLIVATARNARKVLRIMGEHPRAPDGRNDFPPGCRSVVWHGQSFTFSAKLGRVVEELWNAWKRGIRDVDNRRLMEVAESEQDPTRLRSLFRVNQSGKCTKHPALDVMIVKGATAGTHRLADAPPDPRG